MSTLLYVCHAYAAVCLICLRWCMFAMPKLMYVWYAYAVVFLICLRCCMFGPVWFDLIRGSPGFPASSNVRGEGQPADYRPFVTVRVPTDCPGADATWRISLLHWWVTLVSIKPSGTIYLCWAVNTIVRYLDTTLRYASLCMTCNGTEVADNWSNPSFNLLNVLQRYWYYSAQLMKHTVFLILETYQINLFYRYIYFSLGKHT